MSDKQELKSRLFNYYSGRIFFATSAAGTESKAITSHPSISVATGPSYNALVTKNDPGLGLYQQASVSLCKDAIAFISTLLAVDKKSGVVTKTVETEYPIPGTFRTDVYTVSGTAEGNVGVSRETRWKYKNGVEIVATYGDLERKLQLSKAGRLIAEYNTRGVLQQNGNIEAVTKGVRGTPPNSHVVFGPGRTVGANQAVTSRGRNSAYIDTTQSPSRPSQAVSGGTVSGSQRNPTGMTTTHTTTTVTNPAGNTSKTDIWTDSNPYRGTVSQGTHTEIPLPGGGHETVDTDQGTRRDGGVFQHSVKKDSNGNVTEEGHMTQNKDGSGQVTTVKHNADGSTDTTTTTAGPGGSNPQTSETHTTASGTTSSTTPAPAEPEPDPEPVEDDPPPEPKGDDSGGERPSEDGTDEGPRPWWPMGADVEFSQFLVGDGVYLSGNPYATVGSKSRDFGDPPPLDVMIGMMKEDGVGEAGMPTGQWVGGEGDSAMRLGGIDVGMVMAGRFDVQRDPRTKVAALGFLTGLEEGSGELGAAKRAASMITYFG